MFNPFAKKQIPDSTMPHYWEDEDELLFSDENVDSNCPTSDVPSAEWSFMILAIYVVIIIMLVVFALALFVKF